MRATGEATSEAPGKSTSSPSSLGGARDGTQREIRISPPPVDAHRRSAPTILLHQEAHITNGLIRRQPDIDEASNETTATAKGRSGHTIAVSFWVADPPDVSFISVVSCKPPNRDYTRVGFSVLPHVVGAEGRFVLLRTRFFCGCGFDELFMYTAGAGDDSGPPSLELVPFPDNDGGGAAVHRLGRVREYGIVPRGRHYLMAALCSASMDCYQLHIYLSESKTWSFSTLLNPNSGAKTISPEKVITLGEGVLGWVDFSSGLLIINLCQEPQCVRFIPLPRPMPANMDRLELPEASPRLFRDLVCVDGVLKFIEMEHHVKVPEKLGAPCDDDFLYDSDLIRLLQCKDMDNKPKPRDGWRAVTWSRMVSSNCWTKGHIVDVADIVVDGSVDLLLRSGQSGEPDRDLTFRDLYCALPTLSIDNADILYLKSTVEPSDQNGWVVAVDLGNKTVKALGAFPFEKYNPSKQAVRTSTLSCHLVMTPGIEVSAYRKIIQEASHANNPNNTSILVDESSSLEFKRMIQRLSDARENMKRKWEEGKKRSRDESESFIQNDHAVQACARNSFLESSRKHQRLSAERINLPRNEAQSIVQNDHLLQVHPVQNILPPQQCLNKWNQHLAGHSSRPPLNLPPQQCFNMPGGLSDSGYVPLAPPVLHGYGDYQPLRHQLQPFKHERPSSEFEPHKASVYGATPCPWLICLWRTLRRCQQPTAVAVISPNLRSACLFSLAAAASTAASVDPQWCLDLMM